MISEVIVPVMDQAGADVTVARWLKREGDPVQVDEPLCEIETSKASVEITAPAAGILRRIFMPEGAAVPALAVLALIGGAAEPLPQIDPLYRVPSSSRKPAPSSLPAAAAAPSGGPSGRAGTTASPRARKLAAEYGIELGMLVGTGPGGRIVEDDVRRAIEGH